MSERSPHGPMYHFDVSEELEAAPRRLRHFSTLDAMDYEEKSTWMNKAVE